MNGTYGGHSRKHRLADTLPESLPHKSSEEGQTGEGQLKPDAETMEGSEDVTKSHVGVIEELAAPSLGSQQDAGKGQQVEAGTKEEEMEGKEGTGNELMDTTTAETRYVLC